MQIMFVCTILDKELPKLSAEDVEEFSFLNNKEEESLNATSLGDDATS